MGTSIGRAKYRLHNFKKNLGNSTNKFTPRFLKTKKMKSLKSRVIGNPSELKRLRAKIISGSATLEDKLNYRTYHRANSENKIQASSTLASKAALASSPLTGGIGAGAAVAISVGSTVKLAHNLAVRGTERSNKKLSIKPSSELTKRDKARIKKAIEMADNLRSPSSINKYNNELISKKKKELELNNYKKELEKRRLDIKKKKAKEFLNRSRDGKVSLNTLNNISKAYNQIKIGRNEKKLNS